MENFLRRPTPSQAAALQAASMEAMISSSPALVAMLPTVAPPELPPEEIMLAKGGGPRQMRGPRRR